MDDARQRLEPLLRPGEQLRWTGRPDPKVRFGAADVFLVPFSLLWAGFAIVWETMAITGGSSPFFALWGIPFVLLGLYIVFGRFIIKKRRKQNTVYGLTDSRAIVSSGSRSVQDTPLAGVPVTSNRSRDGRHVSVVFGNSKPAVYQNTGLDFFTSGQTPAVAFFDVADPDGLGQALDLVRK